MELFIRIIDGKPFEHPILKDNFCQAFPDVDINNLPQEFERFVRAEPPPLGPYEKNQTVSYQLVDGVYTDVFSCEQMTSEEISEKQQLVKDIWSKNNRFVSWVFDETLCKFVPPISMPTDGKIYRWDETNLTWIELT